MSAQHTAGPWQVAGPCEVTGRYSVIHNGPLFYVSDAGQAGDGKANARLAAAAPDMLAALEMVDRIWRHDQTANISPDSPLAIVRAAIAKATGELL